MDLKIKKFLSPKSPSNSWFSPVPGKEKQYCTGVILDVAQAFDSYQALAPFYLTLKYILTNRSFVFCCEKELSNLQPILVGVPLQGSIIAHTLYNIFTSNNDFYILIIPQKNLDDLQNRFKLGRIFTQISPFTLI